MNGKVNKCFVPEVPARIAIGTQDGYCNLKCPKCFIHSSDRKINMEGLRGEMSLDNLRKILDEVSPINNNVPITANRWSEPLLTKGFPEYINVIKDKGFPVIINTNGLLLDKKLADYFVDVKLDSIAFSIDATTKQTLKNVRGTSELDKIKEAVFLMLEARGGLELPRIGVNFVVEEENRHEEEEFISYWLRHVDVVRVAREFSIDKKIKNFVFQKERTPCHFIYDTMSIDYKGDVSLCCLDAFVELKMGNVFENGVKGVWHDEEFKKARYYHKTAQYDKIPFCKDCDIWSEFNFEESVTDGILIRKSPAVAFYNRMDKLNTWKIRRS